MSISTYDAVSAIPHQRRKALRQVAARTPCTAAPAPASQPSGLRRSGPGFAAATMVAALLAGCSDAQVASHNLSKAADNFEINRRIVFYNGITGDYMLTIEGLCAQEPMDNRLAVTCKTEPSQYKKHFLGLSHNVTYFSEQMEPAAASVFHYRVTFKPAAILPTIDVR